MRGWRRRRPMLAYIKSGQYARDVAAVKASQTACRYCGYPYCTPLYDKPNLCEQCRRLWEALQPGQQDWSKYDAGKGYRPGLDVAKRMIKEIESNDPSQPEGR